MKEDASEVVSIQAQQTPGRVSTGIEGYDNMLNGGFFPGTVNLITGTSGAGKTLFCMNYLYSGAKDFKERGVYLTFEEGKDQILRNSKNIGLDLAAVSDLVTILDIATLRKFFDIDEELQRKDSPLHIGILLDLIKRNCKGTKRVVVDSIVPLSMKYPNIIEFRAQLFRLREHLRNLKATTIFTTEIPISSNDISRFGIEDFLADSVTVLKVDQVGRKLRIHKLRGSDHEKDFINYQITGKGIYVDYLEMMAWKKKDGRTL